MTTRELASSGDSPGHAPQQGILVNGTWITTHDAIEVRNPYDRRLAGRVSRASPLQALEAARSAKSFESHLTAYDRADILRKTADRVERNSAAFVQSICSETGLPLKDAVKEVARATGFLRICAEEATRITGEAIGTDVTSARLRNLAITIREPIGLVCAITPFNRPLNQVVVKVAPAIAANNAVILKPSEKTPLTAIRFVEALLESGLPPRQIALVTGYPAEIGDALVTCGDVDLITFTGSVATAERIARAAGLVRTVFELGDSGALIVLEDADLGAAARAGAAGAFSTSGQSCRGVKRLLVQETVAPEFVRLLETETRKLRVGDPMDPDTDIGTLISEEAAREVDRRVNDAVGGGALLICGGHIEGAQYWPTVLDHVDRNAALVQEETFGPCAPVIRIRDFEDAIACANQTRFGLQTGVFTRDIAKILDAARRLRVGAVVANGGPQFESPNIPFGGVKKSGFGREGARYAIQEMTTIKSLIL